MNNNYNNLKLEESYSKSPIHDYQNPFPHQYNQNNNFSQSPNNVPGPYGITFENERSYNSDNKKRYK